MNHLVTFNVDKVHDDAPLKFVELIQLLRVTNFETIESLWADFKLRPEHRYLQISSSKVLRKVKHAMDIKMI